MGPETSIATFFTTHAALRAEELVRDAGIPGRLIPAPRSVSADCTVALAFPPSDEDRVRGLLADHAVETSGFHRITP